MDGVMAPTDTVIPRSQISVGIELALRTRLPDLAAGRPLVLDYFASRTCSQVIGDLTAAFRRQPPGAAYVELASIEGVHVFAEQRLLPVLKDAALTLRFGGPTFARHLAVSLDPGSRWIEFLEEPTVLAGKRRFRPNR